MYFYLLKVRLYLNQSKEVVAIKIELKIGPRHKGLVLQNGQSYLGTRSGDLRGSIASRSVA